MDNQSNNQQPHVPPQPSQPQSAGQPGYQMPPKKGLSKGALWGIIGGAVALIAIIATVAVVLLTLGPSKADYQPAIDASTDVSDAYRDYSKSSLSRAMLQYSNAMSNLDIALYNYATDGENRLPEVLSSEKLADIEDGERTAARTITQKEQILQERATQLKDAQATEKYDAYVTKRAQLYGEGRTMEDYAETQIQLQRINYACGEAASGSLADEILFVDDAKKFVIYSEGCIAALEGAQDSGALRQQEKSFVDLLHAYLSDTIEALQPMIASDSIDTSALEAITKEHEQNFDAIDTDALEAGSTLDEVEETLDAYFSFLVDRRDNAGGSYAAPRNEDGVSGVAL